MKKTIRILSAVLAVVLLFGMTAMLSGCKKDPYAGMTAEEKILAQRRDTVEQYMREQVSFLWRSTQDIVYETDGMNLKIEAGKLYSGMPYVFCAGTKAAFLEFAGKPDKNGIYTISGLDGDALTGNSRYGRIGNDCSGAVALAWSQISPSFSAHKSGLMLPENGVYPVGDYTWEVEGSELKDTDLIITNNGWETMYEAYAQLQKGDATVHVRGGNHIMMAVSVEVVYREDGSIDPDQSAVIVLEQTRKNFGNKFYEHEKTGEMVHVIGGVDVRYPFKMLAQSGYIPVTIKALIDPSPVEEPKLTDSETVLNKDTLLTGIISCNWMIDTMTLTITDSKGKTVQEASARSSRAALKDFDLQKFVTDKPSTIRGSLDINALASGSYHCTLVCRLTTGQELTARDFDFTV